MTSSLAQPECPPIRVLIVDDDLELCDLLTQYLSRRNFIVERAEDGVQGLIRAQNHFYDLIILDVLLPQLDGFEVLRRIRMGTDRHAHVPVLMVTAYGDGVDRIVGLELGADDYLNKPFDTRELLARMRAILRRVSLNPSTLQPVSLIEVPIGKTNRFQLAAVNESVETTPLLPVPKSLPRQLKAGDIQADCGARVVYQDGNLVRLTATEFELLVLLLRNANVVVARDDIAREVLQRKLMPFDRSLDMHISKLRRKLGTHPNGAERIKTVRGIGFIYAIVEET